MGLGSLILASPGHIGSASHDMVATTFEAIVGAIYLDAGEEAVVKAVKHLGLHVHPSLM